MLNNFMFYSCVVCVHNERVNYPLMMFAAYSIHINHYALYNAYKIITYIVF